MADALITCSHLTFSWPDDTPVFDDLSCTAGPGRTGLVAPNGAGKSTLLRLIAGELIPRSGTATAHGVVGYLPQTLPLSGDRTVAEVLEIAPVLRALRAIEAGDVDEAHFAVVGSDWDVEERARAELGRLGLGDIALDRPLRTCSGGQAVAIGLAAQLLKRPDVLLLDEPTNNLDRDARERLHRVLAEWGGCLLLVSHDRELLDRMDRIAELDHGEIRWYGGNFTAYEQARLAEREVAERNVRNAEQELKREKRERQQARERADRRASNAARNVDSAGLPKILAGARKRRAQESAGRADDTHGQRVDDARRRLDEANRAVREDDVLALSLPDTRVPAGRTLFHGTGIRLDLGGRELFGDGIDLAVRGPERIALSGGNGSGKSTLLRLISGELAPDHGEITRFDGRIASLSQRLDLLDLDRSTAENLRDAAPELPRSEFMHVLARFLFAGDRRHLPVRALSGGERLRATLACVLCAEPAPQLLLLDEPTNNLDLVSTGQLVEAMNAYEGALVVVSHDERFLADVDVPRRLHLSGGVLRDTGGA